MNLPFVIALVVLLVWLILGEFGTRIDEIDPGWVVHVACVLLGGVFLIIQIRDKRRPFRNYWLET